VSNGGRAPEQSVLFRAPILAHFAQVHLVSAGSSPPQFASGEEATIFGPSGVSVAASDWEPVAVEVVADGASADDWSSGWIEVGPQGLDVGNDLAGDSHRLAWPPGPTRLTVQLVVGADRIDLIRFHLDPG
jgi:hypothetical protein